MVYFLTHSTTHLTLIYGWRHKVELEDRIKKIFEWYKGII